MTNSHNRPSRRRVVALMAGLCGVRPIPVLAKISAPVPIDVQSRPISAFDRREPTRQTFGQLRFRGGLVLASGFPQFGGLSAIRVAGDGAQFIALSDHGWWLKGRLRYEGARPVGISEAVMAPMLGPDGQPLADHGWYDTDSIAEDGDTLYVGIERVNQIVRFDYGKDGLLARGHPIAVPPSVRSLPRNQSLEALSGRNTNSAIGTRARPVGESAGVFAGRAQPGSFTVKRTGSFDITDAALLPDGDLVILERSFSFSTGLFVRLRRIAITDIKPVVVVDGPVLLEADLAYEIDNLEGLSIHRAGDGVTVLTLISDDNFSMLQRPLLLQFALDGA